MFEYKFDRASFIPRFYLTSKSVVFVFSEYEVTPGACGSKEVQIRYTDINRFLRSDGPLGLLVPASGDWQASDHFVRGVMEMLNNDDLFETNNTY